MAARNEKLKCRIRILVGFDIFKYAHIPLANYQLQPEVKRGTYCTNPEICYYVISYERDNFLFLLLVSLHKWFRCFFLWEGYLKDKVYATKAATVAERKFSMQQEYSQIANKMGELFPF